MLHQQRPFALFMVLGQERKNKSRAGGKIPKVEQICFALNAPYPISVQENKRGCNSSAFCPRTQTASSQPRALQNLALLSSWAKEKNFPTCRQRPSRLCPARPHHSNRHKHALGRIPRTLTRFVLQCPETSWARNCSRAAVGRSRAKASTPASWGDAQILEQLRAGRAARAAPTADPCSTASAGGPGAAEGQVHPPDRGRAPGRQAAPQRSPGWGQPSHHAPTRAPVAQHHLLSSNVKCQG